MKKLFALILLAVIGTGIYGIYGKTPSANTFNSGVDAKSIYMIDFETGEVLYEENADQSTAIASTTKMMTQYIVLNAITNGRVDWEDTYSPSAYVLAISEKPGYANFPLYKGEEYTVRELFTAASVISANDATIALAEIVGGTEENFVRMMNEQADYFKLKNTQFFNSTGLDGPHMGKTSSETNRSSAHDVAVIASKLISGHPTILDFVNLPFVETEVGIKPNTNLMLKGLAHELPGIDGLKTGYTGEAGSCFVSTGVFKGRRVITVVIGATEHNEDTINPRFRLTKDLINHFAL